MLIGDWKPPVTHKSSTQLRPFIDQSTDAPVDVLVSLGGVVGGVVGGATGGDVGGVDGVAAVRGVYGVCIP